MDFWIPSQITPQILLKRGARNKKSKIENRKRNPIFLFVSKPRHECNFFESAIFQYWQLASSRKSPDLCGWAPLVSHVQKTCNVADPNKLISDPNDQHLRNSFGEVSQWKSWAKASKKKNIRTSLRMLEQHVDPLLMIGIDTLPQLPPTHTPSHMCTPCLAGFATPGEFHSKASRKVRWFVRLRLSILSFCLDCTEWMWMAWSWNGSKEPTRETSTCRTTQTWPKMAWCSWHVRFAISYKVHAVNFVFDLCSAKDGLENEFANSAVCPFLQFAWLRRFPVGTSLKLKPCEDMSCGFAVSHRAKITWQSLKPYNSIWQHNKSSDQKSLFSHLNKSGRIMIHTLKGLFIYGAPGIY